MIAKFLQILTGESPILSYHGRSALLLPELLILFLVGWVLVIYRSLLKKKWQAIPRDLRLGMLFLLAGSVVGCVYASNSSTGIGGMKTWFVFPMILALCIVWFRRVAETVKVLFVGIATLESVYGFVQLVTGHVHGRLLGSFTSPNYLAMLVGPAFAFAVIQLWQTKQKTLWGGIALILLAGVLGTLSVGSLIGLIAGGILLLFRSKLSTVIRFSVIAVLLAFGGIGLAVVLSRVGHGEANSLNSRIQIWRTAVVLGGQQPLTGIGIGNFPRRYVDTVVATINGPPIEWSVPLPHNIILAFWLETGVLGLIGYLYILKEACASRYALAMIPFIVLSGQGLIDTPYFFTPIVYVFWITIALGVAEVRQKRVISSEAV